MTPPYRPGDWNLTNEDGTWKGKESLSAQPPAPDFAAASESVRFFRSRWAPLTSVEREKVDSLASVLSASESRLSLLEAQNAELRASREAWQLEAIDGREVLKHHADRARAAESALEAAKADTERLRMALKEIEGVSNSAVVRGLAYAARSVPQKPTTEIIRSYT